MPYNRLQAERLLAASELPLFLDSLADRLAVHSAAQLRALVKRARTQRDKARDLWQRQRVATRSRTGSKGGRSGDANARTESKARLFDEALQRFERRLAELDAKPVAKPARKPPAKTDAKPTRKLSLKSAVKAAADTKAGAAPVASAAKTPTTAKAAKPAQTAKAGPSAARSAKAPAKTPKPAAPAVGPTSEPARAKRHLSQLQQAGLERVQAHVGARGRRVQAKRDTRR